MALQSTIKRGFRTWKIKQKLMQPKKAYRHGRKRSTYITPQKNRARLTGGRTGGIADEGEVDGGVRQVLLLAPLLHLLGGEGQRLVKTCAEGGVAGLHAAASLQLLPDEKVHVPGGHHVLEHADGRQIRQMLPVVFLSRGPGHQAAFGVVVDHGGGEGVLVVKADHLPVHVAEDLVHVQGKIRQLFPGDGPLGAELGQKGRRLFHADASSFDTFKTISKSV